MIGIGQEITALDNQTRYESNARLSLGQQLETVFLTEMLKFSGIGKTPDAFGGGVGEDQFSSFMREAQAKEMVRAGGLGLAEKIDQVIGVTR